MACTSTPVTDPTRDSKINSKGAICQAALAFSTAPCPAKGREEDPPWKWDPGPESIREAHKTENGFGISIALTVESCCCGEGPWGPGMPIASGLHTGLASLGVWGKNLLTRSGCGDTRGREVATAGSCRGEAGSVSRIPGLEGLPGKASDGGRRSEAFLCGSGLSSVITSLQIRSVPSLQLTLFHNTKSEPGRFSGGPRASPHSLFS